MISKVTQIVMLSVICTSIMCRSTIATTVPFIEDFNTASSDWRGADGTEVLVIMAEGGPDGSAYISETFNFFGSSEGDTPVIFRAQDEFGSSAGAFEGDWINDGVASFSLFIRHDALVPLTFFARFASPFNYPGATAINFAPVQPNAWTKFSFHIDPNNPQFISFEGSDFNSVFSNIGHIQLGFYVPLELAGLDSDYTFDLDNAMIAPNRDAFYFVEPRFWNVGEPNSTYQQWDMFTSTMNNKPDVGRLANPNDLPDPNLNVYPPAFVSSSANFYSFSGNYSISVDVYNHGRSLGTGEPNGYGTHVIIQTAATINDDPNLGGPSGVLPESVEIVDFNDVCIKGGSNSEVLRISEIYRGKVASSWGDVTQQELIWEFFLPDHTADFHVRMESIVHSMFREIRIDTMLADKAYQITPLFVP